MSPRYDVCLSFAGENRPYVNEVAKALKRLGIKVFYDRYEQVALWGKNLYEHLAEIYRNEARYCVIFASASYASKVWPRHELASAQARAIQEHREYILPARFDDTEIPGVHSTTGYVDLRSVQPQQLARLISAKLKESGQSIATINESWKTSTKQVPRTILVGNASLPKLLYHYTTPDGFLGIVTSRSIWATDRRYCRDASDVGYGDALIEKAMRRFAPRLESDPLKGLVFASVRHARIFIAGFSETNDALSQWQRYADASGFSLCFEVATLSRSKIYSIARVLYDVDQQLDLLRRVMAAHSQRAEREITKAKGEYGASALRFATALGSQLATAAARCKPSVFADEREWRIITVGNAATVAKFRVVAGVTQPYIEVPLALTSSSSLPIRSVTLHPRVPANVGLTAASELLAQQGHLQAVVETSRLAQVWR